LAVDPNDIVVGAVDVGAPKNIGWAVLAEGNVETGSDLDDFVELFAKCSAGKPSALGFEAPLFIPYGRPWENSPPNVTETMAAHGPPGPGQR